MSQAQRGNRSLRAIDAVLGVPIVLALSLMRSKSGPPKAPQTIGIMVLGALGDALLTSALVAGIRKTFPNGQIVVFGTRSNQQAFELITGFDRRIEVSLSNPFKALLEVRQASCDCMIDTSQWSRFGAILSALSGARYTIGFKTHGQFRHFAYDEAIVHRATCHELDNFQALGAPLGPKVHA
jgi:heptosyltransferase-3